MTARILLTGGSSFSGTWIALELRRRGHDVVAPLRAAVGDYEGVRSRRIALLGESGVDLVAAAPLGSSRLLEAVAGAGGIDAVVAHHAVVGDYRSPAFDVGRAVSAATAGCGELLDAAGSTGCRVVVLTRSVFEAGAGLSDDPRPIGLYAVAKTATAQTWELQARARGMTTGSLTITNPYGALEEPRFVSYLARTWLAGGTPELRAPHWVRDNVPAPLLAAAYADFVERLVAGERPPDPAPSHRIGSNIAFAEHLAREFGVRWGLPCAVSFATTPDFSEPRIRVGKDPVWWPDEAAETRFYDEFADWYRH